MPDLTPSEYLKQVAAQPPPPPKRKRWQDMLAEAEAVPFEAVSAMDGQMARPVQSGKGLTIRDVVQQVQRKVGKIPVSTLGQGRVHAARVWDHTNSADIAVNPNSDVGRRVMAELDRLGIPYLPSTGKEKWSTGAHIHAGDKSKRTPRPIQQGTVGEKVYGQRDLTPTEFLRTYRAPAPKPERTVDMQGQRPAPAPVSQRLDLMGKPAFERIVEETKPSAEIVVRQPDRTVARSVQPAPKSPGVPSSSLMGLVSKLLGPERTQQAVEAAAVEAANAKDILDRPLNVGESARRLGAATERALVSVPQKLAVAADIIGRAASPTGALQQLGYTPSNSPQPLAEKLQSFTQRAQADINRAYGVDPTKPPSALDVAAEGIGGSADLLIGGALTRSAKVVSAIGAAANAQQTYEEARKKGATPSQAARAAMIAAPIGALEGVLGVESQLASLGVSRTLARRFGDVVKSLPKEVAQEVSTEVLNNLNAAYASGYDKDRRVLNGVVEATIGALGMSGAMGGAGAAARGAKRVGQAVTAPTLDLQAAVNETFGVPSPQAVPPASSTGDSAGTPVVGPAAEASPAPPLATPALFANRLAVSPAQPPTVETDQWAQLDALLSPEQPSVAETVVAAETEYAQALATGEPQTIAETKKKYIGAANAYINTLPVEERAAIRQSPEWLDLTAKPKKGTTASQLTLPSATPLESATATEPQEQAAAAVPRSQPLPDPNRALSGVEVAFLRKYLSPDEIALFTPAEARQMLPQARPKEAVTAVTALPTALPVNAASIKAKLAEIRARRVQQAEGEASNDRTGNPRAGEMAIASQPTGTVRPQPQSQIGAEVRIERGIPAQELSVDNEVNAAAQPDTRPLRPHERYALTRQLGYSAADLKVMSPAEGRNIIAQNTAKPREQIEMERRVRLFDEALSRGDKQAAEREAAALVTLLAARQRQTKDVVAQANLAEQITAIKQQARAVKAASITPAPAAPPVFSNITDDPDYQAQQQRAREREADQRWSEKAEVTSNRPPSEQERREDVSPIALIRRTFGTINPGAMVGEARWAREGGVHGLLSKKARATINDARELLRDSGYRMPDGRSFDDSVYDDEVLEFLVEHGTTARPESVSQRALDQQLAEEEEAYYRSKEESLAEPGEEKRADAKTEQELVDRTAPTDEEIEAMAAREEAERFGAQPFAPATQSERGDVEPQVEPLSEIDLLDRRRMQGQQARRAGIREAAPVGQHGKLASLARKSMGEGSPALADHPDWKRVLDITPDASQQDVLNVIAQDLAGVERSSQMSPQHWLDVLDRFAGDWSADLKTVVSQMLAASEMFSQRRDAFLADATVQKLLNAPVPPRGMAARVRDLQKLAEMYNGAQHEPSNITRHWIEETLKEHRGMAGSGTESDRADAARPDEPRAQAQPEAQTTDDRSQSAESGSAASGAAPAEGQSIRHQQPQLDGAKVVAETDRHLVVEKPEGGETLVKKDSAHLRDEPTTDQQTPAISEEAANALLVKPEAPAPKSTVPQERSISELLGELEKGRTPTLTEKERAAVEARRAKYANRTDAKAAADIAELDRLLAGEMEPTAKGLEKAADEARQRILDALRQTNAVPVAIMADYAIVGAHAVAQGAKTFSAWAQRMLADFGARLRPQLRRIWAEMQQFFADERGMMTVDFSKLPEQVAELRSDVDQYGWYSGLVRTVRNKMQAKANGAQVLAMLQNPNSGVTADEIKWTGIDDFLRGKQSVTKDEVLAWLDQNAVKVEEVVKGQKNTKFSGYALKGADEGTYRELLITFPAQQFNYRVKRSGDILSPSEYAALTEREKKLIGEIVKEPITQNQYQSSHWDEKNVIAHVRYDVRTDAEGKKVMHVAEIQSDWHQARRRREDVSDAPFAKTWHELAFKRIWRIAAENGMDRVTWDTGATNAERYDLSKQVNEIAVVGKDEAEVTLGILDNNDNKISVPGFKHDRDGYVTIPNEKLPDVVGKELADKILAGGEFVRYAGDDLKVGGEGMKGFYDQILPAFAAKYGKKWGAIAGKTKVETFRPLTYWGYVRPSGTEQKSTAWLTREDAIRDAQRDWGSRSGYELKQFSDPAETSPVHFIDITPQMRKSVLEGQPLFGNSGVTLTAPASQRSAQSIEARLRQDLSNLPTNRSQQGTATMIDDLAQWMAGKIGEGINSVRALLRAAVETFGPRIRQFVQTAYNRLVDFAKDELGSNTVDFSDVKKAVAQNPLLRQAKAPEPEISPATKEQLIPLPPGFTWEAYSKELRGTLKKLRDDNKLPEKSIDGLIENIAALKQAVDRGDGAEVVKQRIALHRRLINRKGAIVSDILRPLMLSGDLLLARQGFLGWTSHPILSTKVLLATKGALSPRKGDQVYHRILAQMLHDPHLALAKHAGIDFGAMHELEAGQRLLQSEEGAFATGFAALPIIRQIEHFNKLYMDMYRLAVFSQEMERRKDKKITLVDNKGVPTADTKAFAKHINIVSGRGALGEGKIRAAVEASSAFGLTAPRWAISRFQALGEIGGAMVTTPWRMLHSVKPETGKQIGKDAAKFALAQGGLFGLALAAVALGVADGFEWEDPDSPNWGMLRFGTRRYSVIPGGLRPYARFGGQMVKRALEMGGTAMREGRFDTKAFGHGTEQAGRFGRTRLAPMISGLADQTVFRAPVDEYGRAIDGERAARMSAQELAQYPTRGFDVAGQPATGAESLFHRVAPLTYKNIVNGALEGYEEAGVPGSLKGAALQLPEFIGWDALNYKENQARVEGVPFARRKWQAEGYGDVRDYVTDKGFEEDASFNLRVQQRQPAVNAILQGLQNTEGEQRARILREALDESSMERAMKLRPESVTREAAIDVQKDADWQAVVNDPRYQTLSKQERERLRATFSASYAKYRSRVSEKSDKEVKQARPMPEAAREGARRKAERAMK